jgi:hypothetical protein
VISSSARLKPRRGARLFGAADLGECLGTARRVKKTSKQPIGAFQLFGAPHRPAPAAYLAVAFLAGPRAAGFGRTPAVGSFFT